MNATDMITTGIVLPRIGEFHIVDGQNRLVSVEWKSGKRKGRVDIVDLSPLIDSLKVYRPLRDSADLFNTAKAIRGGTAIAWGEGSIDMSAVSVERLAEEMMTGRDFAAFLERNALTHQGAAAALGRSKRQIENYLQDDILLPRTIALACLGYETRKKNSAPGRSMDEILSSIRRIIEGETLESLARNGLGLEASPTDFTASSQSKVRYRK